jgi:hypothetical protein
MAGGKKEIIPTATLRLLPLPEETTNPNSMHCITLKMWEDVELPCPGTGHTYYLPPLCGECGHAGGCRENADTLMREDKMAVLRPPGIVRQIQCWSNARRDIIYLRKGGSVQDSPMKLLNFYLIGRSAATSTWQSSRWEEEERQCGGQCRR